MDDGWQVTFFGAFFFAYGVFSLWWGGVPLTGFKWRYFTLRGADGIRLAIIYTVMGLATFLISIFLPDKTLGFTCLCIDGIIIAGTNAYYAMIGPME